MDQHVYFILYLLCDDIALRNVWICEDGLKI